jgi:hypothetical protein
MDQALAEYYRCPDSSSAIKLTNPVSSDAGYFRFGRDTVCYGRSSTGFRSKSPAAPLYDVFEDASFEDAKVYLPFDPTEVVTNLRYERYMRNSRGGYKQLMERAVRSAYYCARPFLGVSVRKHLQKHRLNGWRNLPFPHWPIDVTVDSLLKKLLLLVLKSRNAEPLPFIWFWPEGASACAIMTHDVETEKGAAFCPELMDINDAFRIPASFQVVPEKRYPVTERYLDDIRQRGFEVNVQDLNHDGHLFRDQRTISMPPGMARWASARECSITTWIGTIC